MITLLLLVQYLLIVVTWVIVIQAVMSWLLAFNVINTYNDTVRTIWQTLRKLTDPIYNPIRRIMPDFGPLDLSPMVVLLILYALSNILIPRMILSMQGLATP